MLAGQGRLRCRVRRWARRWHGRLVHLGEGPGREGRRWSGSIAEPRVGSGGL